MIYLFNRGVVTSKQLGVLVASLVRRKIAMFSADPKIHPHLRKCRQCWEGVPIDTELGHGKKWLAEAIAAGTTFQTMSL